MSSYAPQTPSPTKRAKKSSSRSRISHHLLRGGSSSVDSTTTPNNRPTNNTPESPILLNALKLAACSGGGSRDSIDDDYSYEGFSPLPMSPSDERIRSSSSEHSLASSYANSIEAMAATVEAAATNRQRPRKSPKTSPRKSSSGRQPHYAQTRKQLFSSTNNNNYKRVVSKVTIGHFVAIVILVPFLMMEAFLSVLVFTYNHNGIHHIISGGEGLLVATGDNKYDAAAAAAIDFHAADDDDFAHNQQQQVVVVENAGEETDEEVDVIGDKSEVRDYVNEDVAKAGTDGVADHPQAVENENEIESDDEEGDAFKSQIVAMQSMLKDALTLISDGSDKIGKEEVKMLCLTVWNRGVEALSLPNDYDDEDNDRLKALAMDAQRCLGGAELAFLSRDVNIESVTNSRVIFESLSDVDPYNANVRAGLGTSLLVLGIMQEDDSVVKLATFYLKAASSLCQKGAEEVQPHSILFQSDASAMSAAILHNLALANIYMGDDVSSVSLLLRASAIRRELSSHSVNLFWNCPDDVLLTIEQRAVLMGAKRTRSQKKKKSKIPFLSDRFAVKEAAA